MFDIENCEIEWGGKTLKLETGRVARQADGAVLATLGETVVLCAVTAAKSVKPGQDFFPLTVHYQEKFSAAGRIPGGFFKRERGATEKETLTSRLIDRPIRPLFPEGFYNEVLVIAQVLSYDGENEPDILAMIAASAALTLSGVPFMGPIGAARVGYIDGEYILNPTQDADRRRPARPRRRRHPRRGDDGRIRSQGAVGRGDARRRHVRPRGDRKKVCEAIIKLAEKAAKEPWELATSDDKTAIKDKLKDLIGKDIEAAYKLTDKSERSAALNAARDKAKPKRSPKPTRRSRWSPSRLVKSLEADIVRGAILKEGRRIDGRDTKTVRPIEAIVGFLPRTHGSALFTRGETQAIVTTTLGTKDSRADDRRAGGPLLLSASCCTITSRPIRSAKSAASAPRRGARSATASSPGARFTRCCRRVEEFPYTIRVLSDITESNGSSSMATVCGGSLAMMDAGVPLEAPGRGHRHGPDPRRQGLRGDQRHPRRRGSPRRHGLQGRRHQSEGITSLQMDIKVAGITEEIMKAALAQAKDGRAHILGEMAKALDHTREELSAHAPRIETMQIPKDKIREVIGTGGKVIREIVADDRRQGRHRRRGRDQDQLVRPVADRGRAPVDPRHRRRAGARHDLHRQGRQHRRFRRVRDLHAAARTAWSTSPRSRTSGSRTSATSLTEGQEVKVKLLEVDQRGKVRLSMRLVDQETGEELPDTRPPREPREGGDRGPRGDRGDRGGRGRDRDRGPRRDGGGRDRDRGRDGGDRDRGPRGEGRGDRGPRARA